MSTGQVDVALIGEIYFGGGPAFGGPAKSYQTLGVGQGTVASRLAPRSMIFASTT